MHDCNAHRGQAKPQCGNNVLAQEVKHEETPAEKKRREKQERKEKRVRYR